MHGCIHEMPGGSIAGQGHGCEPDGAVLRGTGAGPCAMAGPEPRRAGRAGTDGDAGGAGMLCNGNGSGCGSDDPLARMRCSARLAGGSRALADATAALAGRDGGCDVTAADAGTLIWLTAAAEAGRAGREATGSMQTRQSTQRQTNGPSPVEEGRGGGGAVVSQTEPPKKSSGPDP